MSVFVNSLKTFESDITGEIREYKINNAVWLLLKAKFGLTQTEWANGYDQETVIFGAKFIVCVLKSNGLDVTEQEVIENTNSSDIMMFVISYQAAMVESNGNKSKNQEEDDEGK